MQLLDEALGEVDTIEGKLSSYEEMLQSVKDQMDQISQSNHLIQISNTNNGKLLDEIQFLVVGNTDLVLQFACFYRIPWRYGSIRMSLFCTFVFRTTWTSPKDTSEPWLTETCLPLKASRPALTPPRPSCSASAWLSGQVSARAHTHTYTVECRAFPHCFAVISHSLFRLFLIMLFFHFSSRTRQTKSCEAAAGAVF